MIQKQVYRILHTLEQIFYFCFTSRRHVQTLTIGGPWKLKLNLKEKEWILRQINRLQEQAQKKEKPTVAALYQLIVLELNANACSAISFQLIKDLIETGRKQIQAREATYLKRGAERAKITEMRTWSIFINHLHSKVISLQQRIKNKHE
jgi:hypothetical protein